MEGEKALAEARKLHSAYSQQNHEVEAQLSRVKVMEEHITQVSRQLFSMFVSPDNNGQNILACDKLCFKTSELAINVH